MRTLIVLLLPLAALTIPAGKRQGPAATSATNAQRARGVFLGDYEVRATSACGLVSRIATSACGVPGVTQDDRFNKYSCIPKLACGA